MHAAVDVGILGLVIAHHRINDGLGFLTGRRVIEVDQRLPVHGLPEEREVVPTSGNADELVELFCQGFRTRCCHDGTVEMRPCRSRR